MARFSLLCALVLCFFASTLAQNEINFNFNGMIPPASPAHGGWGNGATEEADVESQISELLVEWVAIADNVASLTDGVAATYGSVVGNYFTSNAIISLDGVNGLSTLYNGVSGALQYLQDLSNTRNASLTALSDLQFTWNNDQSVTVTTPYTGYETVWPAGTSDSFFGTRTFTVVAAGSSWLISYLSRSRLATLQAEDATEEIGQLLAQWVAISDAAATITSVSAVDSAYSSVVGDYFTTDASISVTGVNGLSSQYSGVSGALSYLEDISTSHNASVTTLSDFQFTWNADGSASVTAPYTGYEVIFPSGDSNTFFGIRTFTVVRENQSWLISALSRNRVATVPDTDTWDQIGQVLSQWVAISDAVAAITSVATVDSTYSSVVGDYFTTDASISVTGVNGLSSQYSGLSGALSYLEDISTSHNSSSTVLGNFIFTSNDASDDSWTVTTTYVGYESIWPSQASNIFFGIRTFVVEQVGDAWLISSLTRARTVTLAQ